MLVRIIHSSDEPAQRWVRLDAAGGHPVRRSPLSCKIYENASVLGAWICVRLPNLELSDGERVVA